MRCLLTHVVLPVLMPLACGAGPTAKDVFKSPEPKPDNITVVSPLDYQVIQRRSRTQGMIPIRIRIERGRGASVEYRLSGEPLEGKLDSAWRPLAADGKGVEYHVDALAPAGGWYRMDLRILEKGKVTGDLAVEHVGVGEVFVIAGQSNSTNHGTPKQRP